MFYIVGNKRFMNVRTARAEGYKAVKKTGKSVDLYKATAKGTVDAGTIMLGPNGKVYYAPFKGKTHILYRDGGIEG